MSPNKHLPGLDLLRASAITLVLGYHASIFFRHPPELSAWVSFGWTGVDLFFVLSGYLITSQLLAARDHGGIKLSTYFLKRGCRILPAYWLMVAVYFSFPSWSEIQSPAPLWKFLSFTQNLGLDTVHNRGFSHAWSLCIEEQFYLAVPLVMLAARRRLNLTTFVTGILTLMLAGLLVRWISWETLVRPHTTFNAQGLATWCKEWGTWIYYPTQCRLDGLLTGMLIAGVFHWRPQLKLWTGRHAGLFLAAGASLLTVGWLLSAPMTRQSCALFGYPIIALAYGALLISSLAPSLKIPRFLKPIVTWVALLSYSVYLSHKVVGHMLQTWLIQWGLEPEGWMLFTCLITGCFLVGMLIHLSIERPFLRLRDRLLTRRPAAEPGQPVRQESPVLN